MNPLPFDLASVEAPFFDGLVGQKFVARSLDAPEAAPLELELSNVQLFHHRAETGGRAPFSLLFKTDAPLTASAQGSYDCTGPGLDSTPIFLVPVRDPLRGICLEAVFN